MTVSTHVLWVPLALHVLRVSLRTTEETKGCMVREQAILTSHGQLLILSRGELKEVT